MNFEDLFLIYSAYKKNLSSRTIKSIARLEEKFIEKNSFNFKKFWLLYSQNHEKINEITEFGLKTKEDLKYLFSEVIHHDNSIINLSKIQDSRKKLKESTDQKKRVYSRKSVCRVKENNPFSFLKNK
ncbi:MAG: hypothetical protein RL259_416 [Bacteroidota bacterium]|jgi:hypothetical protein